MIRWFAVILLWAIAAAFAGSDVLCVMALVHHRKDPEFRVVLSVVVMIFAVFAAGAAYAALAVGRCL